MQRKWITIISVGIFLILSAGSGFAAETATNTYFDLGVFAYEQGNYQEAFDLFNRALNPDPYNVSLYHYLGKTCLKLERTEYAAHCLEVVRKMEPGRAGLSYDLALLYQQQKEYGKALEQFRRVMKEDPANVLAVFQAGVSLYQMNRWEEAINDLQRAGRMNPSVKANADYYAGICEYRLGKSDMAMQYFTSAKATASSDQLQQNAEKWVQILQREEKDRIPYRLYAKAGMQYDDNVVLQPLDVDIFADKSDTAFVGYLSGKYNLINRPQFKAGAGYSHYQTLHSDLTEYDITGSIGDFYLDYRQFPYSVGFSYQPSYYWVDTDKFLLRHAFTPAVSWQMNDKTEATFSYTYLLNHYFTDEGRDGHANAANVDVTRVFKSGYVSGGMGVELNSASHRDECYDQFEARFSTGWPVIEKIRMTLTGIYDNKNYDAADKDLGTSTVRDDNRYYADLSLSRPTFYKWLFLSVDYEYTRNNSNIDLFEYERNAVTLSVAANL